ncbi:alpha/beta fold hydrolase [Sulfitobacter sp. F26204]|uniref:alpha/beta fold hydrolase n=1 Tax=Sulfitobacter sp. F26204 TaxID=2996014 RepID=UPI00225E1AB4|nr:alpha/beta hydrolase [Sulfitobacter sp. F26204]
MILGNGARRTLALHCTMGFGGAWAGLSKALPELTFIAPDMPSHGSSVDWDEASDFGETVFQASVAAMDDGPMDVIGHSFGAMIALRMAVEYPEKIRSLTMIEPVFMAIAKLDAPESLNSHDTEAQPFRDAIDAGHYEAAARSFNRMWSDEDTVWDALSERTRTAMARAIHVVPNTYGLLYDDTAGLLNEGVLEACRIPTLIMRGALSYDAITVTNNGLATRMPNAQQAVIDGAGHMAPITHPAEVAAALAPHLAGS